MISVKNFTQAPTAIDSACTFQNFLRVVPFQVGFEVFLGDHFCFAASDWTFDFLRATTPFSESLAWNGRGISTRTPFTWNVISSKMFVEP
jgi:hypothetical protein